MAGPPNRACWAVGARRPDFTLCKSGRTCGRVDSYNVSVTYSDPDGGPDTVVTGLGSSSVCTQGGDSGGAYIFGNQAQGMTSGAYFQPLDDALSHYGLSLNTA
jgi:hypothetical protein